MILTVGLLGLASAVFEAVGLSFMIPLARIAMGEGIDFAIPVIGPLLRSLGSRVELSGTLVVLLVVRSLLKRRHRRRDLRSGLADLGEQAKRQTRRHAKQARKEAARRSAEARTLAAKQAKQVGKRAAKQAASR